MIRNIWRYRRYIINNSIQELKYRYAGSTIGVFWNVLNPLFQILVYAIVFSRIMLVRMENVSYYNSFTIYLCSGLLAWIGFSECITRGTNTIIENSTFLKKLPIPEEVFIAQGAFSSFLNVGISYTLFVIYILITVKKLSIHMIAVPAILIMFLLFGFGIALFLSVINVFFRDIYQVLNIFMMVWMWLTPIVYIKDILPVAMKKFLLYNPAYWYIEALHKLIVYNTWLTFNECFIIIILALIFPVLGFFVLSKLRREIRDLL